MDQDTARECAARWRAFAESLRMAGRPASQPEANRLLRDLHRELDRRYREAHRHYHDWTHVLACLRELEEVRSLSPHPQALEMALWYHDAVYDPGAPDNEQRSAELAVEAAQRLGLAAAPAAEVRALILATRHAGEPPPPLCPPDQALILDIDLAILGKPREVFDRYEEGIRREYQAVPPDRRRETRLRILEGFLGRPVIYRTAYFRGRYERAARENLGRSVEALRRGVPPPP